MTGIDDVPDPDYLTGASGHEDLREEIEWQNTSDADEDEEVSHPNAPSPPVPETDNDDTSERMVHVSKSVLDDLSKKKERLEVLCAEQSERLQELQSAQTDSESIIEELRASQIDAEQLTDIVADAVESNRQERDGLTNHIEALLNAQTTAEKQIKRLSISVAVKKRRIESQQGTISALQGDIGKLDAGNVAIQHAVEAHITTIHDRESVIAAHKHTISTCHVQIAKLHEDIAWSNDWHKTSAEGWATEIRRTQLANESQSLLSRLLNHGLIYQPRKGSEKDRLSGTTWADAAVWADQYNLYNPTNKIDISISTPSKNRVVRALSEMLPHQMMRLDYRHSNMKA